MKKSNEILEEIDRIKQELRGVIIVEGSRELKAGDVYDSKVVDEGEHVSIGGQIRVEREPAGGEERAKLLKKLSELRKLYDEAVKKEEDDFILRETQRIAKEIKEKGTVTCYGFNKEFRLPPDEAEAYYRNIGNLGMAEAVRKAIESLRKESKDAGGHQEKKYGGCILYPSCTDCPDVCALDRIETAYEDVCPHCGAKNSSSLLKSLAIEDYCKCQKCGEIYRIWHS